MGGGTYSVDVGYSDAGSTHSVKSKAVYSSVSAPKPEVQPVPKRVLKIDVKNPVALLLDGTGSMGDSARVAYDKAPMIWGQIEQQRFLADTAMALAIVGDEHSDRYPIQVSEFAKGLAIHEEFPKLYLEGGGGGTMQESYEAVVHYILDHAEFTNGHEHPFCFIVGDEAPYPSHKDLTTKEIMAQFGATWDTWLLHRDYSGRGRSHDDQRILKEWSAVLDPSRIVQFHDMKALADLILGIISIRMGLRNLDEYAKDMELREQTPERVAMVRTCLANVQPAPGIVVKSASDLADLSGLLALLGVASVDAAVLKIDQLRGTPPTAGRPNVAGLYGMLDYLKVFTVDEAEAEIERLLGKKP